MKAVYVMAGALVCLAGTAYATGAITYISGTHSGTGEIVDEYTNSAGETVFILDETLTFSGPLSGVTTYNPSKLEVVVVGASGVGTYEQKKNFTGTILGVPCSGVIKEKGIVDLTTDPASWQGKWKIKNSTCNAQGKGTTRNEGVFTSETEYTVTGTYMGKVHF